MTSGRGPADEVLFVAPPSSALRQWLHLCGDAAIACAADEADARRFLVDRDFARVVLAVERPSAGDQQFLADVAALRPRAQRIVCVDDGELAEAVRTGVARTAQRVVPRPRTGLALAKVLAGEEQADSEGLPQTLIAWTAALAARMPEAVVRPHRRDGELQLVVQGGTAFGTFMRDAEVRWGPPRTVASARGRPDPSQLVRDLGALKRGQKVYSSEEGELSCALLVLPWANAPRVTLVLRALGGDAKASIEGGRTAALAQLRTFFIPEGVPHPRNPAVRYLAEYDWVATPTYVGPDRRKRSTSLFNRYALVGRRALFAESSVSSSFSGFVDKVPRRVSALFWAGILLCLVDACLTMKFVTAEQVNELNPLLRPLVTQAPALFWVVKTLGSVAALAVVARFHSFARWRWLLPTLVALYLLLVLYWAALLV